MTAPTAEQQQQISSIKGQLEIIFAAVRNCSDLEAADEIARAAHNIKGKLMVLEGTPQAATTKRAA